MAGRPARHMVHGEWMTIYEAAERLGTTYKTIENWRTVHRREDGSRALLADYWDWAMRVRRGEIPRRPGKHVRTYWVHGKQLTMMQAAQRVGVTYKAMHCYVRTHGCTVNAAVKYYERRAIQRAVNEIMAVINEARREKRGSRDNGAV